MLNDTQHRLHDRRRGRPDPRDRAFAGAGDVEYLGPFALKPVGDAVRVTFGDRCSTFETFLKVINPKSYVYEQLVLTPEERDFWALEVEQIRNYLNDSPPMAWEYRQRWNAYWELPGELGPDPLSNREFLRGIGGEVEDILDDISRVCKASVTTDNPIELSLQRRDDSDDPAAGAILFRAHFV